MSPWDPAGSIGRGLVLVGVLCAITGAAILILRERPGLGRLPLDVTVERPGFAFSFPEGTCILVSLILTAILWAISRMLS